MGWIKRTLRAGVETLFGSEGSLRRLDPGGNLARSYRRRIAKYVGTALLLSICGTVAGKIYDLKNPGKIGEGGYVMRGAPGEGSLSYELRASDGESSCDISFRVSEQRIYGEELDSFFERAYEYIENALPGEAESTDEIAERVVLVNSIPGTPVLVEWETPDPACFYSDGRVRKDKIKEPIVTVLTATLTYFDEVRLRMIPVRVVPPAPHEESFEEKLGALLTNNDDDQSVTGHMQLPTEMDGRSVEWAEAPDNTGTLLVCLGIAAGVLLIPAGKAELKSSLRKRDDQMICDHPDIVSKFIMLTTAGMTCRAAFERIVRDYERSRPSSDERKRFAYEEMRVSLAELELGIPEEKVYESFGDRCGLLPYQRFGTLLARNVRRGSRELNRLLELESEDSFATRRERAGSRSEELGTKLLLPMMIMMCIVIAIVIVPAFRSFNL